MKAKLLAIFACFAVFTTVQAQQTGVEPECDALNQSVILDNNTVSQDFTLYQGAFPITGYAAYWDYDNQVLDTVPSFKVDAFQGTFSVTGLIPNHKYAIRFWFSNAYGVSAVTYGAPFTMLATALPTLSQKPVICFVSGTVLQISNADAFLEKPLIVSNILGQKVFEQKITNASETVNVSSFTKGVYIVSIGNDGSSGIIKKISIK